MFNRRVGAQNKGARHLKSAGPLIKLVQHTCSIELSNEIAEMCSPGAWIELCLAITIPVSDDMNMVPSLSADTIAKACFDCFDCLCRKSVGN